MTSLKQLLESYYFPRGIFLAPPDKVSEFQVLMKKHHIKQTSESYELGKSIAIPANLKPIWKLKTNSEDRIIWVVKQNPDWRIISSRQFTSKETFDYLGFEPWVVYIEYNHMSGTGFKRVRGKKKAISLIAKVKKVFEKNNEEIFDVFD